MSVYTPVVTPVVSSVGVDNPHYIANFNGTDQYGVMAEWVPSGGLWGLTLKGSSNILAAGDFFVGNSASSDESRIGTSGAGTIVAKFGGVFVDSGYHYQADEELNMVVSGDATSLTFSVNGSTGTALTPPNTSLISVDRVASSAPASSYLNGTISNLRLTSHTALQNVMALQGNGTDIYVGVPEIVLSGDFEIEFDVSVNSTSTNGMILAGSSSDTFLQVNTNGALFVRFGGTYSTSANSLIVAGETYRIQVLNIDSTIVISVDGVEAINVPTGGAVNTLDRALTYLSGKFVNGTIANLRITDNTLPDNANQYLYPLTYDINETDPTSKNIARQVGTVSGGDGTVYNATKSDYVRIEQNSRFYPMDEGSGAVCRDVFGDNPMTLINSDTNTWSEA